MTWLPGLIDGHVTGGEDGVNFILFLFPYSDVDVDIDARTARGLKCVREDVNISGNVLCKSVTFVTQDEKEED